MGYPYNYWVGDYILKKGTYLAGTAIFSKYPIIKTFRLQYNGERKDKAFESLIAADLDLGKDTIRVFTTHLQSILLKDDDYKPRWLERSWIKVPIPKLFAGTLMMCPILTLILP